MENNVSKENINHDCIFCKIANKKFNSKIIFENDVICCFLDIDPINIGHVLIIPKMHYLDVDELDDYTAISIMRISIIITKLLKELYNPDGYSIMQNGGEFNDVGHYHMHVFPRYKGDGFGWTYGDVSVTEEEQELLRKKLSDELRDTELTK